MAPEGCDLVASVRTVDPIRRGLRHHLLPCILPVARSVRTVDPIRRGLRLFFSAFLGFGFACVRTVDPIRRGLRPSNTLAFDTPLVL